ncbi:MAG: neutral zinc metallopeptidase [Chloroflexota bacterium]
MTFNPGSQLDPGQISDRRGMGRGGVALGGGGAIGIILLLAYTLLGGNPSDLGPILQPGAVTGPESSALTECKTGADANARDDCRILGYVNSVQKYWSDDFATSGQTYEPAKTVLFTGATQSGCGTASSSTGPFYCPLDKLVYLDLDFFKELHSRFGAQAGSLAQGYVVAHEYGHHIQDLLGNLQGAGGNDTGATGRSVRTELQADCFAGVWANHAASTGYLQALTDAQIADALDAASAVGDDRIQQATQGQVNPDSWTHGSSAQRQKWFTTGYQTGDPSKCDTSGTI